MLFYSRWISLILIILLCIFNWSNSNASNSDTNKELLLYEKAAGLGSAEAQYNLGRMYDNGDGVSQDQKKAVSLYTKAAEQGYVEAQKALGFMYSNGDGVAKDKKLAFEWYTKAAIRGDVKSQYNLGSMFSLGDGVAQDRQKAIEWYAKAAEQGHTGAQHDLEVIRAQNGDLERNKDKEKSPKVYTKEAERGNADAQYKLGEQYENGEGVTQDKKKAVEWYTKAAEQGLFAAQYKLGIMYDEGKGVGKDQVAAAKWFAEAAGNAAAEARYNVVARSNNKGAVPDKDKTVLNNDSNINFKKNGESVPRKNASEEEIANNFKNNLRVSQENITNLVKSITSERSVFHSGELYVYDFYIAEDLRYDITKSSSIISPYSAHIHCDIKHIYISSKDRSSVDDCVNPNELIPSCRLFNYLNRAFKNNINDNYNKMWQDNSLNITIQLSYESEKGWSVSGSSGTVSHYLRNDEQINVSSDYHSKKYYNAIVNSFQM